MESFSLVDDDVGDRDQLMSDPDELQLPTQLVLPALDADVRGTAFSSDFDASSFQPMPTSGTHHSDEYNPARPDAAHKRDLVSDAASLDPGYAQSILDRLQFEQEGWCELVKLQPTKAGGYIQVSFGGANKFAMLQLVVLWADGQDLWHPGDQCSHRCHRPQCKFVGHVTAESAMVNNSRKGCLVWIDCHHCAKKIFICMHDPCCIKFAPGFQSLEDFLDNGVCRFLLEETRQQARDNAMIASTSGVADE